MAWAIASGSHVEHKTVPRHVKSLLLLLFLVHSGLAAAAVDTTRDADEEDPR